MTIGHYKNLIVWQKSIDLVDQVYLLTRQFPKNEVYGLASQMQRSAVAIPSNIAEGQSRNRLKEYLQFLGVAYGSVAELDTQLIIAKRQYPEFNYVRGEELLLEILKMLSVIITKLQTSAPSKT